MNVEQLTVEALDAFCASRVQISVSEKKYRPRAANTTVKELEILRAFFGFCASRGWCSGNPAKAIKTPKVQPNQIVPYTREEIADILAACDQLGQEAYERLRTKAAILLMRHTGLRISDALLLRRDQVRDGALMRFTKKTGGHILLPIPGGLEHALQCLPLPMGAEHDTGYFFWNGRSDHQTLITDVSRALKSVFDKSGVRGAHAHRFRHTLATEILGKGGTMGQVADILGITEQIARKHYAKWSKQRQEQIWQIKTSIQQPELQNAVTKSLHDRSQTVNELKMQS